MQIINESFENAWSPSPTGWYQEEIASGSGGGSNQYWQQSVYDGNWLPAGHGDSNGAAAGNSVAWYNDYDAQAGQIDRLATNNIDLSATTNPVVSFYIYYENGGTTWNEISTSLTET